MDLEDICVKRKKLDLEIEVLIGLFSCEVQKVKFIGIIVECWLEGDGREGGEQRDIDEKVYFSYKMNKI